MRRISVGTDRKNSSNAGTAQGKEWTRPCREVTSLHNQPPRQALTQAGAFRFGLIPEGKRHQGVPAGFALNPQRRGHQGIGSGGMSPGRHPLPAGS